MTNIKVVPHDVSKSQELESHDLDFPIECYEKFCGAAADRSGTAQIGPLHGHFLG